MNILKLLASDGFISVNKAMIKRFGLNQAVIIGFFATMHEYHQESDDGWFFVIYEDKEDESRNTVKNQIGISRDQYDRAVKNLVENGILFTKKKGIPMRKFYKFNLEAINNLFSCNQPIESIKSTPRSSFGKPERLFSGNPKDCLPETPKIVCQNSQRYIYKKESIKKEMNLSQQKNEIPTFEEVDEEVKRRERENLIKKGFKTKEFYQWLVDNWDTLEKKSINAQIYSASKKDINFEKLSNSKPLKPVRSLSDNEHIAIAWAKLSGSFEIRNELDGCSINDISKSRLKFDAGEMFYEIDDAFPINTYKKLFSSLKINLRKI